MKKFLSVMLVALALASVVPVTAATTQKSFDTFLIFDASAPLIDLENLTLDTPTMVSVMDCPFTATCESLECLSSWSEGYAYDHGVDPNSWPTYEDACGETIFSSQLLNICVCKWIAAGSPCTYTPPHIEDPPND